MPVRVFLNGSYDAEIIFRTSQERNTMIVLACVIWLGLVIVLSNLITHLLTGITSGFFFRSMIFPGVLVHELSHYVLCLLTGAKVVELKLFEKQQHGSQTVYGGHVTHGPAKLPLIGDPLISFAPVFGCLAMMGLLTWVTNDPLGLLKHDAQEATAGNLMILLRGVFSVVVALPGRIVDNATDWTFWGYLYLIGSLAIALAPSKQDFANSYRHVWQNLLKFVLAGAVVFLLVTIAGTLLERLGDVITPYLVGVFGFTLSILIVTWLLAWILNLAIRGLRRRV